MPKNIRNENDPPTQDITGQKFNRLTASKFVRWKIYSTGKRQQIWEFVCACGKITIAYLPNVKRGHTTSCGCFLEHRRVEAATTHGDGHKSAPNYRFYVIWCGMKQRCEDESNALYPRWGGRGIKVMWQSYEEFKKDMFQSYEPHLTIERIDNDGNYCKENCRWATHAEQALNTRKSRFITCFGETLNMCVWERRFGLARGVVAKRLNLGWPLETALTTPSIKRNH